MIRRWFNPVLFFGAAGYLRYYHATHSDSALLFPFVEHLVGPDLEAQKQASFFLLIGVGLITTGVAVYDTLRARPQPGG